MVGTVSVLRRYFWSRATTGLCPVDALLGVDDNTATRGARRLCCTLGIIHDFTQGVEDLYVVAGIRIPDERLRQLVEKEGRDVLAARSSGALAPVWSAPQAGRVYVGVDGVLVRAVTQDEKQKRRQQPETRGEARQEAGEGNTKPLAPLRPGTADNFREMKIGLFYDQEKTRVLTFATQKDHIGFGRLGLPNRCRPPPTGGATRDSLWLSALLPSASGCEQAAESEQGEGGGFGDHPSTKSHVVVRAQVAKGGVPAVAPSPLPQIAISVGSISPSDCAAQSRG